MKTLFIDLASHQGLLAAVSGEAMVSERRMAERVSDAEIPSLVAGVVNDAGWEMSAIKRIACVTGPGGFMSLRVGVSLANALSWGLHVPIAGVHLSDMWAARASRHGDSSASSRESMTTSPIRQAQGDVLWLHSSKKDLLFVRGFGEHAASWPEAVPLAIAELLHRLSPGVTFTGELLPEHEAMIVAQGAVRAAARQIQDVLPALVSSASFAKEFLQPWYGRGW